MGGYLRHAVPVLVIGIPFLLFWKTGHFAFVTRDDYSHVMLNPFLREPFLDALGRLLAGPFQGLYVPVSYAAWGLVGGLSRWLLGAVHPAPFHLAAVALHALNAWLLYRILGKGLRPGAAAAGALLFAVHPLQVEAVAWISCFKDLLAAAFSLTAVLWTLEGRSWWLATGAFLLGILSKPVAAVTPLLAWSLAWAWQGRRSPWPFVPWLAAGAAVLGLTRLAQPGPDFDPVVRAQVAVDALAFYLSRFLFPLDLGLYQGRDPGTVARLGWNPLALTLLAAAFWGAIRLRRARWPLAAALWVLAPLLPVLGWVPFFQQAYSTVADRFAYLAVAGFALAAVHLPRAAVVPLIAVFALLSARQLEHWRDDAAVYSRMTRLAPTAENHYRLAMAQNAVGRKDEALANLRRAVELDGRDARFRNNLALLFAERGEMAEAERELRAALAHSPDSAALHGNLGTLLSRDGRTEEGERHRKRAREIERLGRERRNGG